MEASLALILTIRRYFLKAEKFHSSPKHPVAKPADHRTSGPWETGFPSETAVSVLQDSLRSVRPDVRSAH